MLTTLQTSRTPHDNQALNISKDPAASRHSISLRSPTFKENHVPPPPQSKRFLSDSDLSSSDIHTGSAANRNGRRPSDTAIKNDRKGSESSTSEPPAPNRPLPPQDQARPPPPNQVRPPTMKKKEVNPFIVPKRKKK